MSDFVSCLAVSLNQQISCIKIAAATKKKSKKKIVLKAL